MGLADTGRSEGGGAEGGGARRGVERRGAHAGGGSGRHNRRLGWGLGVGDLGRLETSDGGLRAWAARGTDMGAAHAWYCYMAKNSYR